MKRIDPTGEQVVLRAQGDLGEVTAQIAQVGASLRALTVGGVDLMARYPEGERTPSASGIVLVPWPNRIRDGRWSQRGATEQLGISEPKYGNASHGLLRFAPYEIVAGDAEATLSAVVYPQTGYLFTLATSVTYTLVDDGLAVTHRIRNAGDGEAPVALGTHPFFEIGGVDTADLVIAAPGTTWFEVDDRMLPVAEHDVDDATDLRGGVRLGDVALDRAYGDVVRGEDGLARTTLTAPDGRTLTVWQDESFGFVQVFTTENYPGRDLAVAIEPMTAPADAFNSGRALTWLAPGEEWVLRWGVSYSG
ncbi:aldose 1-epimerase [Microbacterium barkeri]|uniref:Aldose 1-epimerase n=1 Tax=Microbacterium barkeri TaxID=33917 RepID=A0A9W6LWW0_9MICO|nr:aldose 1-epimerase family protein [Microbacterium barkeri]MDR6877971.1 aldose 1-epimerase [Microbacterium barkeri]GLJ61796.1 aldose 1-epimerase [Microbacterium barkeri]